jgi:hypothetical protein
MKRFIKYFTPALILSALVLFFSCDANKLELTNPNQLSPDTYFTTPSQVQSAVNAVYGSLQTTGMYNRGMWYSSENMAHENTCNSQQEADKREWLNFSFGPNHGLMEAYWSSCYRGINKANFVINNEQAMTDNIPTSILPAATRDKYIGEAKFLRALYYFNLVTRYGDIPLYLGTDPAEKDGLAKSPKEAVWAQIEADCADAAAKCLSKAAEEPGRVTSGAAWALLGKARLYQENYSGALEAFNNITGYSLEPEYFRNFMEETENGPESLFEVQFNIEAGYSQQWNSDRTDEGKNESTFRAQEYGCLNWFNVFVSEDLWNEFETAADNGSKIDPRRGYCAYQTGDLYNNNTMTITVDPVTVLDKDGNQIDFYQRRGWRKYQNYYKAATEGAVAGNQSGINMKVIRYADVLLMKAEAEANRPGGSLTAAVALMNQVRARADVNLPLYGTAAMNTSYPVSNLAQFMVALEHERKVELCGEQVRYGDLVRWGRLADFIQNECKPTTPKADQAALVFNPAKHYLWPIPQKEIDVNPNIEQTDQNPGW